MNNLEIKERTATLVQYIDIDGKRYYIVNHVQFHQMNITFFYPRHQSFYYIIVKEI